MTGLVAPAQPSESTGRRAERAEEFGKVGVLHGGTSAEREVSLASGAAVLKGLQDGGVDAHPVDVGEGVVELLEAGGFDRVFNMLHGRGGEDGTIQGLLEVLGIPYTGSGILGSALAMDKQRTKLIWQSVGLPVAPSQPIRSEGDLESVADELGFPLMVKPVHEGSSIGVTKTSDLEGLLSAWWVAARYDDQIIAEPWIDGIEYTVAILDREVLPVIRLEPARTFYDYEAKYGDDAGTNYVCPCGLEPTMEARLSEMCLRAFDAVAASGWGRVDLMCDASGQPWLLEVNTNPGMTSHSLVPMAARASGLSFERLVWRILETTL